MDYIGNHGVLFLVVGVVLVRAIGYLIVVATGTVPVPSKKNSGCDNTYQVSEDDSRGQTPCAVTC